MEIIQYRAESRGHRQEGWLDARHTFSFSSYFDPTRTHLGALRVLNDDTIDKGRGFGMFPNNNMEIITIPLKGSLKHQDSLGNNEILKTGEVQVISAGTGISYNESNADKNNHLNLLQIWIYPSKKGVKPRYQHKKINAFREKNILHPIIAPEPSPEQLWIHQDAHLHMGKFDKKMELKYKLQSRNTGVFVMVIEGRFEIAGETLERRDCLGVSEASLIHIKSLLSGSQIVLIEVPMHV